LIIAVGRTILSEITKVIKSIWNREEMLEKRKESIVVAICIKGDETEFSEYRGISFWSITYKHLFFILLSKLTPNAEEFIRDH
jgi:hypothetical protein